MFNLDPNNPESLNSTPEPQSDTPDQARQDLESQQKIETDELNRQNLKNKSEAVDSASSSRADLMSDLGPIPAPNPESQTGAANPQPDQLEKATAGFGDKFKNIVDKFKGIFGAISTKFTDFFNKVFNIKPDQSPSGSEQANSTPNPSPTEASTPTPTPQLDQSKNADLDIAADETKGLKGEALLNNEKFKARTEQIATKLGCSVDDLYAIFKMESGADPQAVNSVSKATGLIQWMPKYAPQFGTTTTELGKMTGLQQLDYVEKFFSRYFGKLHTFPDLYRAVFWPAAIGKSPDYIFQTSTQTAELVAKQNPGIAKVAGRPDGFIDNAGFEKYANKFNPKNQKIS